jgi:Sec-independent protein secretion pathway component TatC
MAIPLLLFYETGIIALRFMEKRREREAKLEETETDTTED